MSNDNFEELCKDIVRKYALEHLDKTDKVESFLVYIVWR